jgi:hypothetical protein
MASSSDRDALAALLLDHADLILLAEEVEASLLAAQQRAA